MAMKLEEVLSACEWLEGDFTAGGLPAENTTYETIYQLNHVPKLSDELSRGRTVVYPVPRLSEWLGNVINQVISYATFPVLTSLGPSITPSEADKLEASLSLGLAEVNEGQALTKEAYRGFLKQTHVIYQVVPGAPNDPWPFSVTLPDIATCSFERFKGGRPPMLSRSYDMLVRDAEKKYSNKRGDHEGAGQKATWEGTMMRWTPLSGEARHDEPGGMSGSKLGDIVHIKELYDGDWCYHVVCGANKDGQKYEQEVLRQPSVTGGVPFMVIPSSPQGAKMWREDWRPIGWSLYTRNLQIERIETIRATRAEHVQDHIISRLPPDQQEAVEKLKTAGYTPTLHGGVNFIPMAAEEVAFWTQQPDADLAQRSAELKEEMERHIASWLYPATEQTISQANVGTAQIGMQVVHQQESGLLSNHTRGMAGCAEMMLHGLAHKYLGDREVYAKDETTYGRMGAKKVEPGAAIRLDAALLKKVKVYGPDANVRVEVVTRSETESELEQREAGVWNNVQRGSQTFDEFIAVRNPDVAGQHEALAAEGVDKNLAAVFDAAIPMIAAKRNLERWGVDVSALMQPVMPGAAPVGAGGGTTVMQATPATGGVDVSSRGAAPAGAVTQ